MYRVVAVKEEGSSKIVVFQGHQVHARIAWDALNVVLRIATLYGQSDIEEWYMESDDSGEWEITK